MTRLYSLHQFRIRFVSIMFFIFSTAILGKMFYIQSFQASGHRETTLNAGITERSVKGFRGDIYDRNGQALAETIKTYTFWANTHKEVDKERIAGLFSRVFGNPADSYRQLLSYNKNYIVLAQGIPRFQCEPILDELKDINNDLKQGKSNPRDLKRRLAREIVTIYHDPQAAETAENDFDALFIAKDEPDDMPEYKLSAPEKLVSVMVDNNLVSSNGEGRRLISQGGVKINKKKVDDIHTTLRTGEELVIKVGKRKFLRIIN